MHCMLSVLCLQTVHSRSIVLFNFCSDVFKLFVIHFMLTHESQRSFEECISVAASNQPVMWLMMLLSSATVVSVAKLSLTVMKIIEMSSSTTPLQKSTHALAHLVTTPEYQTDRAFDVAVSLFLFLCCK